MSISVVCFYTDIPILDQADNNSHNKANTKIFLAWSGVGELSVGYLKLLLILHEQFSINFLMSMHVLLFIINIYKTNNVNVCSNIQGVPKKAEC